MIIDDMVHVINVGDSRAFMSIDGGAQIGVLSRDHKPEDEESKRLTFQQATTGASGIESLLSLGLELVHNGSCDLNTLINNLTSSPAKILGIRNGTLSVGSEADIAVFDLDKPWVFKKENIARVYSIYHFPQFFMSQFDRKFGGGRTSDHSVSSFVRSFSRN